MTRWFAGNQTTLMGTMYALVSNGIPEWHVKDDPQGSGGYFIDIPGLDPDDLFAVRLVHRGLEPRNPERPQ